MWSEEEVRNVEPEALSRSTPYPGNAGLVRARIAKCNLSRSGAYAHELSRGTSPVVIYTPEPERHGNFIEASYQNICSHPEWRRRLSKAHTSKRQARPLGPDELTRPWCELDSANSSDALLMNVFCYPRVLTNSRLCTLLGVEAGLEPVFGHRARVPLLRSRTDRTEIDMRLGDLFVEAKLTETDFQFAPLRRLEAYVGFDRQLLDITSRGVRSYQLIRGVLAAYAQFSAHFCVLCDADRSDLIEAWYGIIRAVRSFQMQARLRLLTWQEVASTLPPLLRVFLAEKYGIEGRAKDGDPTSFDERTSSQA